MPRFAKAPRGIQGEMQLGTGASDSRFVGTSSTARIDLPHGWSRFRIHDVAEERRQRAMPGLNAEVFAMTKYDGFVRSADYFDRQVFSRDVSNYKLVRRGDLAYATIHLDEGSIGILDSADFALLSPMYTVVSTRGETVEPKYLHRLLKQPWMMAEYGRLGHGSVHRRKSISFDRLGQLSISLPPLAEQRCILEVLNSIDEAIEKTEAVIAATEQLRAALLQELLTRGIPGCHSGYKDMPGIGTIPACWEVVRLGDLLALTQYGTNTTLGDTPAGIAVLRMGNLINGEVSYDELKWAELSAAERTTLLLAPGDILFNRTNSLDLVGKVSVVRELPFATSFASYLVRLSTKPEQADPYWLNAYLNWGPIQERIRRLATKGVSQANINPTNLRSVEVARPPLHEQTRIVTILDSLDGRRRAEQKVLAQLRLLKGETADALLSGRVRVHVQERTSG